MTTASESRKRTAFDCKHVKSVRAWALLHPSALDSHRGAGRIVADFSDNPASSVCTATVHVWAGPLAEMPGTTGRAGGYGYCKFSAAVDSALRRAGQNPGDMQGAGESAVRKWFEGKGYTVIEVC